jgi:O-antigen ligase
MDAAFQLVRLNPLTGTGVGPARFVSEGPGGTAEAALYVHNEYLQLLVDLGAIGALLLLALFGAVALTARRGWPGRSAATPLAALTAFAVHSGFDFLWHIAVLPVLAGLLVGLVVPEAPGPRAPSEELQGSINASPGEEQA